MPVEGSARLRAGGLVAAGRKSLAWVVGAVVAVLVVWRWIVLVRDAPGDLAFDFRQFWQGARDVVNGVSPYPSPELLATAGDHLGPVGIQEVFRFPYPAGAAVALAPFGYLGFEVAATVWCTFLVASIAAALWVLGVRDWRVYAVAFTSVPVMSAIHLGTFTPVLVLLAAAAWRWRDRARVAGGAVALAITLKLFLWPLVVWLAATRRYAAAGVATGLSIAMTLGAWAVIDFNGLLQYPELVRRLGDVVAGRGYSLVALGLELGAPFPVARLLPGIVGLALLTYAVVLARRDSGCEAASFSVAVVAAIALSPIVWLHSLALLVVPLALAYPRIAWAWGLMWVFWLAMAQGNLGDIWRLVLVGAAVCLAIVLSVRVRRPREAST